MRLVVFLFAFFLSIFSCIGQDSIRVDSELSIETVGQHNLLALGDGRNCFSCSNGLIQDNPLFHLPIYTGFEHKLTLNNKYSLETGLYLEERSLSGGNNTLVNFVVFPKILIQVEDTVSINDHKIGVLIKGGDLWDQDVSDMIRFYNVDYQGIVGKLFYGEWEGSIMSIGDLSKNVGLDIHQTYRLALGYRNTRFWNQLSATINQLIMVPNGNSTSSDITFSNYSYYDIAPNLSFKGQIDMRINSELSNSIGAGLQMDYSTNNLSFTGALRYYSPSYNVGHDGRLPNYIGINGEYVGDQLYPLKNFYRPFSQWAAYTHLASKDLIAVSFLSHWDRKLYKKIGLFYDLDMNYIYDVSLRNNSFIPLYNVGFQIYFLNSFKVKASITNKHMELRDSYQTFMASKNPYLSLGVHLKLTEIKLKPFYLKS